MMYNSKFRSDMWDKYTEVQNKVQDLKSIVQNPSDVTDEDLEQQRKIGNEIIYKLQELQIRLEQGE